MDAKEIVKLDAGEKRLVALGMNKADAARLRRFRSSWLERLGGGRIGEVVRVAVVIEDAADTSDVIHVTSEPIFGGVGLLDRVSERIAAVVEQLVALELVDALPESAAAELRTAADKLGEQAAIVRAATEAGGRIAFERGRAHGRQSSAAKAAAKRRAAS